MKRSPLSWLGIAALGIAAGCGQPARPQAKADPALQPQLEPPRQVVVIPKPEPVRAPKPISQAAPPAAKADPNAALASRVKQALEEESRIQAAAIDVTAAGGTVTLWGTAASDDEKARATRAAQRVVGVKWVNNKLAIDSGS